MYFYHLAVERAGDPAEVDVEQFTYPGPRPRSRETAILMLADTCESTVRARRPTSKQEIADIVQEMFDARMRANQLDESGLTLNDIKAIRAIFIDMLQAVFHPRINYPVSDQPAQPSSVKGVTDTGVPVLRTDTSLQPEVSRARSPEERKTEVSTLVSPVEPETPRPKLKTGEIPVLDDTDEAPLTEVPPLPRTGEHRKVEDNGRKESQNIAKPNEIRDNE
jgi:hypothetical protein